MKSESVFSGHLRPLLRDIGWMVQSVETGGTGVGVPDLYIVKSGVAGWMELKIMAHPWPNDKKIPFRPAQWPWLHTHAQHGGNSWLGVQYANGYVFCRISDVVAGTSEGYYIKKEGRSLLYLPRLNIVVLDKWLLQC